MTCPMHKHLTERVMPLRIEMENNTTATEMKGSTVQKLEYFSFQIVEKDKLLHPNSEHRKIVTK